MGRGEVRPQAKLSSHLETPPGSARPGSGAPDRRRPNKASVSPGYSRSRTQDRAQAQDADLGGKRPDTTLTLGESLKHAGGNLDERTRRDEAFSTGFITAGQTPAGESRVWGLGKGHRGTADPLSAGGARGKVGGQGWEGGRLPVSSLSPQSALFFLKFIYLF